ncbi:UNVERIFIED_CONTAM: gag-polyprotein putative aspartyl protease [Acetivibrio alkalicellulosi]
MNKIKFDYTSNLMMLNVYLWNIRMSKFENMLITYDTGASNTVISKDILFLLGYDFEGVEKTRIITASSVEYVEPIILKKFKIGNYILEDVQVYAHTFPEASFSLGVLGLNIIRQFDTSILFSKGELILSKIED